MRFFDQLAISTSFPLCYNLLPHYASEGQNRAGLMDFVEEALDDGRIQTFFVSDHPSLPQKLSSPELAEDIIAAGGEPLVSLALTFDDRESVLEKLQQYRRIGVRQFLFVSGDYPIKPDKKAMKPVYDLDCIQLLMLVNGSDDSAELQSIAKGCAISPFKTLESEQVWQYEKLKRKINVGADFVITQLGFDIRKFDELIRYCRQENIAVPLVANITVTDQRTVRLIQGKNIPGVKVPDRLLSILDHESPASRHTGAESLSRTAKTLAVLRGLGYSGILIGGNSANFPDIKVVLDEAASLRSDWQSFLPDLDYSDSSFYYFQKDTQTHLNNNRPSPVTQKNFPSLLYSFSYFIDWLVYLPQGPLFKLTGRLCLFSSNRKFWYRFMWLQEFLSKGLLYGCTMCGDCVLYACGFLCYQSGCPKKSVNGPCGGSINGYCELYPGKKKCYWVRVYNQMKGVSQHVTYTAPPIPARNNTLSRTSSWINYFMGRDHRKLHFTKD